MHSNPMLPKPTISWLLSGIQNWAKRITIPPTIISVSLVRLMRFYQIVLSLNYIAIKRTFFDKYGEEKLKEGFFSNGSILIYPLFRSQGRLHFCRQSRRDLREVLRHFQSFRIVDWYHLFSFISRYRRIREFGIPFQSCFWSPTFLRNSTSQKFGGPSRMHSLWARQRLKQKSLIPEISPE